MENYTSKNIREAQIGLKGFKKKKKGYKVGWVDREIGVDLGRVKGWGVNTIKAHCIKLLKN